LNLCSSMPDLLALIATGADMLHHLLRVNLAAQLLSRLTRCTHTRAHTRTYKDHKSEQVSAMMSRSSRYSKESTYFLKCSPLLSHISLGYAAPRHNSLTYPDPCPRLTHALSLVLDVLSPVARPLCRCVLGVDQLNFFSRCIRGWLRNSLLRRVALQLGVGPSGDKVRLLANIRVRRGMAVPTTPATLSLPCLKPRWQGGAILQPFLFRASSRDGRVEGGRGGSNGIPSIPSGRLSSPVAM